MLLKKLREKYDYTVIENNEEIKEYSLFTGQKGYIVNQFDGHVFTIFNYMFDCRRGVWINIVEKHNEIILVQIQCGREGDDYIETYIINEDKFYDFFTRDELEYYVGIDDDNTTFCKLEDIDLDRHFCYIGDNLKELIEKREGVS